MLLIPNVPSYKQIKIYVLIDRHRGCFPFGALLCSVAEMIEASSR